MKFIRYGKYTGEPADAIDLEELIKRLGDFFLQSGFESQFYGVSQMDPERSMEALRQAILRALQEGDLLPEDGMSDELREMLRDPNAMNSQAVKDLLDKLTERLANEASSIRNSPRKSRRLRKLPRAANSASRMNASPKRASRSPTKP
jgi:Ca-activated chloride channel family protein